MPPFSPYRRQSVNASPRSGMAPQMVKERDQSTEGQKQQDHKAAMVKRTDPTSGPTFVADAVQTNHSHKLFIQAEC